MTDPRKDSIQYTFFFLSDKTGVTLRHLNSWRVLNSRSWLSGYSENNLLKSRKHFSLLFCGVWLLPDSSAGCAVPSCLPLLLLSVGTFLLPHFCLLSCCASSACLITAPNGRLYCPRWLSSQMTQSCHEAGRRDTVPAVALVFFLLHWKIHSRLIFLSKK